MLPIVQEAIARALSRLDAKERTQLATADEGDIGTSLEAKLSAVERGDVGALNGVARILGDRPDLAPQVRDRLDRAAAANPDLGRRIHDKIDAGRDWTSRSGGANSVLNLLKGFSGSLGAEASRSTTSRRETSEFGASASANLSLGEWVGHHEQKTVRDNSGWKAMLPATRANTWPEGRVGGASSNSSRGNWEQGDWPVVAEFGLFYRLAPREAR